MSLRDVYGLLKRFENLFRVLTSTKALARRPKEQRKGKENEYSR